MLVELLIVKVTNEVQLFSETAVIFFAIHNEFFAVHIFLGVVIFCFVDD
jgi:hypothetical protein